MKPFSFLPYVFRRLLGDWFPALAVVWPLGWAAGPALAQAPTITAVSPARQAIAAPRAAPVAVTFSQQMSTAAASAGAVRVFSARRGGLLNAAGGGTATASGSTITFDPTTDFEPGETVSATVTTAAQSLGGVALTMGQVVQFTVGAGSAAGTFVAAPAVPLGVDVYAVAVGDLNEDGLPDFATANLFSSSVSIRLGDGTGHFSGTSTVTTGLDTRALALGDLNNDGHLDLLTANAAANTVSIRLGTGTGAFTGALNVPVGAGPNAVAVADVNADGNLDFLTANSSAGTVSVRLGNGAGAFTAAPDVVPGPSPRQLAVADFNADGALDLAIVVGGSHTVGIWSGDGTGLFAATATVATGNNPTAVVAADFNADGRADLAVTNDLDNTLGVALATGPAAFGAVSTVAVGALPLAVAAADVDGDGDLDLLTACAGANAVSVRLNNGAGTFSGTASVPVGSGPAGLAVADLDGNGTLDLLAANKRSDDVSVALNQLPFVITALTPGRNAIAAPRLTQVAVTFSQPLAAPTLGALRVFSSQSGRRAGTVSMVGELVKLVPTTQFQPGEVVSVTTTTAAQSVGGQPLARGHVHQFTAAAGVGPAAFVAAADVPVGLVPRNVVVADVNGDRKLDLLTANYNASTVSIRLGAGGGSFGTGADVPIGTPPTHVALADLDADGDPDLLTANSSANTVSVRFNAGGVFSGALAVAVGAGPTHLATGDVDGDGDLDFVTANNMAGATTVSVRLNTGSGAFVVAPDVIVGAQPSRVALTDLDGDGDLDLAASNTGSNTVSVRLGDGTGHFTAAADVPVGNTPQLTTADVNADGKPDLLTANYSANTVSVRLNTGAGTFTPAPDLPVGFSPIAVAAADVDGDGLLDLIVVNLGDYHLSLWHNTGGGTFSPLPDVVVGLEASDVAVADLDGDFDLDLLIADELTNQVHVRLNQEPPFVITGLAPARNAVAASRSAAVAVTFSAPVAPVTAGAVRVFGAQTGRRFGTAAATGFTATLQPVAAFEPGEEVSVTTTTAAQSLGGQVLPRGYVHQFRAAAGVGPGQFTGGPGIADGYFTSRATLADVNADGRPDLLYCRLSLVVGEASNVVVRLGSPGGAFGAPALLPLPVDVAGSSVVVADLDGDGDPDLLVANFLNDSFCRFFNNGSGGFTPAALVVVGGAVEDIATGDVDGDGDLDVVVADYDGHLAVWPNDGAGNFPALSQSLPMSRHLSTLTVADLNADGTLDVLAADVESAQVYRRLGAGTGTFGALDSVAMGDGLPHPLYSGPTDVLVVDVTGDGRPDLLTPDRYGTTVSLRHGLGTGAFGPRTTVGVGLGPSSLNVADVDGDGDLDLLVVNYSSKSVSLRLNDGLGSFSGTRELLTAGETTGLAVADLDGDLDLDLVASSRVAGTGSQTEHSVFLNQLEPPFVITALAPARDAVAASPGAPVAVTFSAAVTHATAAALWVFGGQTGRRVGAGTTAGATVTLTPAAAFRPGEEVSVTTTTAARSVGGQTLARGHVHQFRAAAGVGPGEFTNGAVTAAGATTMGATLADVNGDGQPDLLYSVASTQQAVVRLGASGGTFGPPVTLPVGINPGPVEPADLDGDGDLDLLVANYHSGSVSRFFNDGSGSFTVATPLSVGSLPVGVTTGDVDGDGDLDLAVTQTFSSQVYVFRNDGTGAFPLPYQALPMGPLAFSATLADMNADGALDLLTNSLSESKVYWRRGDGLGAFGLLDSVRTGDYPIALTLADVTGDGSPDLLTLSEFDSVTVQPGTVAGTFGPRTHLAVGENAHTLKVADVDGDGDLDLLVAGSAGVSVRLNMGAGTFSGTRLLPLEAGALAVADLDGDLDLDFVVSSSYFSGTFTTYLNQTPPDLVISTSALVPAGIYHNITVTGTGDGTLSGPVDVTGTLRVQAGGQLRDGCAPITGPGTFVLEAGATLTICHAEGISLTGPSGMVQVTGSRSFSPGASYIYLASGYQQTGRGLPAEVRDLTIGGPLPVTLTFPVSIRRLLALTGAGDLTLGAYRLTLLSSAAGTALVVNTGAGRVVGTATVQRYLTPGTAPGLGYRHLSSPVENSTVADLAVAGAGGFSPVVNAAYNALPTPTLPAARFPTVFAFDERRAPASADFGLGYYSPATLTAALEPGRGYAVYMRPLTPDFVGTLATGDVPLVNLTRTGSFLANTQKSGWHLFGNPYPAPIDWDLVTPGAGPGQRPAGLSASISVYKSTGGNNGGYLTRANGMGSLPDGLIPMGQAFFVRVTDPLPQSFTFTNALRVTDYQNPAHYRPAADPRPVLSLVLRQPGALAAERAEATLYCQAGATTALDAEFDGEQPAHNQGAVPTLVSLAATGDELAVNGLPEAVLTQPATVELLLDLPAAGRYELTPGQWANLPAPTTVELLDRLTSTRYDLSQAPTVRFTAPQAGEVRGRFALVFNAASTVTSTSPLAPLTADLSLHPNPAHGTVHVTVGAGSPAIKLLDATGRLVRTVAATAGSATLDLTGLAPGVYGVRAGAITQRLVVE